MNAVRWIRSSNDPWRYYPAVVNYSGGVASWESDFATLNTTVRNLVTTTQIPFFTSAENFAGDACMFSPNYLAYTNVDHTGVVFTVGGTSVGTGTDKNDYRWQKWDANSNQPLVGEGAESDGRRCVSIYAPALEVYAARNAATNAYDTATGTSFSSPMTAAIAARYMELTGFTDYVNVYNYLLSAVASTGTVVNNINTVEYWLCPPDYTSRTSITSCPNGYLGRPVHMPATFNESNAGMVYSNMTCP